MIPPYEDISLGDNIPKFPHPTLTEDPHHVGDRPPRPSVGCYSEVIVIVSQSQRMYISVNALLALRSSTILKLSVTSRQNMQNCAPPPGTLCVEPRVSNSPPEK